MVGRDRHSTTLCNFRQMSLRSGNETRPIVIAASHTLKCGGCGSRDKANTLHMTTDHGKPTDHRFLRPDRLATAKECNSPDLSALIYPALTETIQSDQIMIYLVNALCLCFVPLYFLPWAVLCLACLYISCTVIASIELDTVNTNRFMVRS